MKDYPHLYVISKVVSNLGFMISAFSRFSCLLNLLIIDSPSIKTPAAYMVKFPGLMNG